MYSQANPAFELKRKPRGGSGTGHGRFAQAELLKLKKSGQFPDEPVRIKVARIHYVISQTGNGKHKRHSCRGVTIILSSILSDLVSRGVIIVVSSILSDLPLTQLEAMVGSSYFRNGRGRCGEYKVVFIMNRESES
jgi:hypothetical protein